MTSPFTITEIAINHYSRSEGEPVVSLQVSGYNNDDPSLSYTLTDTATRETPLDDRVDSFSGPGMDKKPLTVEEANEFLQTARQEAWFALTTIMEQPLDRFLSQENSGFLKGSVWQESGKTNLQTLGGLWVLLKEADFNRNDDTHLLSVRIFGDGSDPSLAIHMKWNNEAGVFPRSIVTDLTRNAATYESMGCWALLFGVVSLDGPRSLAACAECPL